MWLVEVRNHPPNDSEAIARSNDDTCREDQLCEFPALHVIDEGSEGLLCTRGGHAGFRCFSTLCWGKLALHISIGLPLGNM